MDRFKELSFYLEDCTSNPQSSNLSSLQNRLERARPAFLSLLDIPPKNAKERERIGKGTAAGSFVYVPTGGVFPAGVSLAKDVLFLSDVLSASEDLCASCISFGINDTTRAGKIEGRAEVGLEVFLSERANLIRCLQMIWKGALSPDETLISSGVQKVLFKETQELTAGKGSSGGGVGKVSFIQKILSAIDSSKEMVEILERGLVGNGETLATVQQRISFSDDTTKAHIWYRKDERNLLSQLLFLIGTAEQMNSRDTLLLLQQLSRIPSSDSISIYLLVATLSTLEASGEDLEPHHLASDPAFVDEVNKILKTNWTYPQLRSTVQLQWTIFLDSAARHIDNFETDGGEAVESMTWQAIEGGTLSFLGRVVLGFKRDAEVDDVWQGIGSNMTDLAGRIEIDESFQDYITEQVERLVLEIITNKILILRKLRNREEDALSASHRGGHRVTRGQEERPVEPKHDLEALFLLIATIYRSTPDAGLKFWDESLADNSPITQQTSSRLGAFLRWGSECRPLGMKRAYYEMVASLASGPQSATHAFEFLSANGNDGNSNYQSPPSPDFSWSTLFGALDFYHTSLPDKPAEAGANAEGGTGEMPPEEVPLLRSFVRLLRQVVAFSDVARATLYDNQRHRPIATLFSLLGRPIPLELKASLLGAISAFSRPGGTFGVDVARRTWAALELSQILPTLAVSEGRDARGGAGMGLMNTSQGVMRGAIPLSIEGGIFTELEEVEAPNKIYPQSTAFVELLNNLIHTPSSLEPIQRGIEIDTQTIPDNLGSPHRAPGIDPYVRFVVDDVLLKSSIREFSDLTERWKVTEVCLAFVEKCLGSYDLGPFLASAATGGQQLVGGINSPLAHLILHPGFDILTRILSAGDLLDSILTVIIAGYDAISQNLAGTPLFAQCMLRCMRIIKRTLELQSPFLEVVLPTLGDGLVFIPQDKINRLKSLAPVDQSLLYHSEAIVQIALLVGCEEEDEISLLAVQILAILSESPFFDVVQRFPDQNRGQLNRLVGLLESSPETLRIQTSFVNRLNYELFESELDTGEWDGADSSGSIRQAIRSSILDLFLQNTQQDRTGPNIAHLLLGFNVQSRQSEMEIDDPDFATTQLTSLHIILGLLNPLKSDEEEDELQFTLLERYPTLAAKCYRLIRQLCLHPYTSAALSRYLRNREKFFLRQCVFLPLAIPSASKGPLGSIKYPDGKKIETSSTAVCAIFQSEAWLLESTALEMNILATGNDTQRQLELVRTLFVSPTTERDDSVFRSSGVQQGLPRMLEIFHSFDFAWSDSIQATDVRITYFAELRFDSCLKIDSNGCELYDFGALLSLISAAKRELQNRGIINTQAQYEEIKKETRAIVETLVIENHRREIQFARLHSLRAWRSLLDITLATSFHLLPRESRHSLLLDLMIAILPPIAAQETDQAISELLSGAAVLLMTKLRDEGIRTIFVDSVDPIQAASPEQLHGILRSILHAILQPGISAIVRGNLYAFLLNYVQYSTKIASSSPSLTRALGDETIASMNDDVSSMDGLSSVGGVRRGRRNALESGNLAILQSAIDRLLPIICRDATVGHEVWRTVAFTVLDTLTAAAQEGRATTKVISILSKQGYLPSFVASLKDREVELLEALKPEPESLNALYVYEAQMSFLIRLASTREGAEKLLSAELLSKLAQCEYLGSRPQNDSSASMDFDGFIPPATERHHQLLLLALQVAVGAVVSFGSETPMATRQAIEFVAGQRETLLLALKDCAAHQTVSSLREAHLIVTLLGIVLPSVPDEDFSTLSSFGGLHSTLLGLSAKVCGSQEWISRVVPTNDGEREDENVMTMSLRVSGTLFSEKVTNLAESLEAALLTYFTISTRKRAGTNAFVPIYTPSLRYGENGATLGSATAFIRSTITTLSGRLSDVLNIAQIVDTFESTSTRELEENLNLPGEERVGDSAEYRNRLLQEVLALQVSYKLLVDTSLHLLEISLLLLYRNVKFFLDTERESRENTSSRPDFGLGLAESLARGGGSGLNNSTTTNVNLVDLKESFVEEFRGIADKLSKLELTQATVGSHYRGREMWIGSLARVIQAI